MSTLGRFHLNSKKQEDIKEVTTEEEIQKGVRKCDQRGKWWCRDREAMIKFTPRVIQILIRKENTDNVTKEELKTDSSIETKKAEQEQHSERVTC